MVDAVPSRVRKGSEQLPAVAVEQLVVRVARAVGQVIPRQQMELRFGQVAIVPPAHLSTEQKTSITPGFRLDNPFPLKWRI